jgi:hypothetical protein
MTVAMLAKPAGAEVLSWQGVGPVQLGMTVKAAERALKARLLPRALPYADDRCYETWRANGKDPGVGYVVENGKITVIQVYVSDGKTPDVTDTHGLSIGSGEDGIQRAYAEAKKSPGFYDRGEAGSDPPPEKSATSAGTGYVPEFWIEAESPEHKRAILFVTKANKITSMNTGLKPMVLEPEHCL